MRNFSSAPTSLHNNSHQQLLTSAVDFNRARSSESTENTMMGMGPSSNKNKNKTESSSSAAMSVISGFSSSSSGGGYSEEGRNVQISPKKMPPTPPRDLGSPYKYNGAVHGHSHGHHNAGAPTTAHAVAASDMRQPFLNTQDFHFSSSSYQPSPFLQPSSSSWRNKDVADHNTHNNTSIMTTMSSIFRSSTTIVSPTSSREEDGFYTIQRCSAFDEDDSDDDDDDYDSDCGMMAEF